MPKLTKNNLAMTLVELLTATVLVGIIMLGVVAIELAMRRTFSTTSKSASLSMRVSAVMIHFSRNIAQAIGNRGTPGIDEGILLDTDTAPCTKLYVRQDKDGSPADYTNDTWVRYLHVNTSENASLMFCDNLGVGVTPADDPGCPATCPNGNAFELLKVRSLNYRIIKDDVNLQYYTEVNLSTYADNTQAYDPIKNPKIENMQTKINYMSHSW